MNPVKEEIGNVLDYSHEITGLNHFILYGGIPLDVIVRGNYHDIDIATEGKDEEDIVALNKRFIDKDFEVVQPRRPYHIYNGSVEVLLVYAKNDKDFFDVCFMDDLSLIGLFDIESSYWRYPEQDYVDKYDALSALESKSIQPIREFESENPLLWLSRFVRLCSKYDFQVTHVSHTATIDAINSRLAYNEQTVSSPQYSSAVASVFSTILGSRDRQCFSRELIDSGLISKILPELDTFLRETDEQTLLGIKSRDEFCSILRKNISPENTEPFDKRLAGLGYRSWEDG